MYDVSAGARRITTVIDFDSATSTLAISPSASWVAVVDANDGYALSNKVELISDDGQWAAESLGGGTYRLFVWARGGGNPSGYTIEGDRRGHYLGNMSITGDYWIVDNLEFRHYKNYTCVTGPGNHVTVQNCLFHHNGNTGVRASGDYWTIKYCTSIYNFSGLSARGDYVLFENCDVGWNLVDGVTTTGPGGEESHDLATVRGCYIHHHTGFNHADSIQTWNNHTHLLIEDCLLYGAVQNLMGEDVLDTTLRNNVVLGAQAYSLILGGGNGIQTVQKNTVFGSGFSVYNCGTQPTDQLHEDNISVYGGIGGSGTVWTNQLGSSFYSDYNCLWVGDGQTLSPIIYHNYTHDTWDQYRTRSGQDADSFHAQPLLTNMPAYFVVNDHTRQYENTATSICLVDVDDLNLFEVGDHIEVNWDGVVRTVTALDTQDCRLHFTPGDEYIMLLGKLVANWKDKTDYQIDITPTAGSPAKNSASDSGDMGSSINVKQWQACDFNGDGRRDTPSLPESE